MKEYIGFGWTMNFPLYTVQTRDLFLCRMWSQGGRARHAFAWPGWKQSDISVEMEPARLGNSRFKKGCVKCVLLSYPSTELEATLTV
jgi:hypothetical protein